jgi:cell division protein FtsX
MDPTTLEQIAQNAVVMFGKTSTHAITITDMPDAEHIDLHNPRYKRLIRDIKEFLEMIESITYNGEETDQFAHVLRTIRTADQFAMMHILSAMSKLRGLHPIVDTLKRWVEITHHRKEAEASHA